MCHGPDLLRSMMATITIRREENWGRKQRQNKREENGRSGLIDYFREEDGRGSLTFSTRPHNSIFGSPLTP
jgi:hypothetical protein